MAGRAARASTTIPPIRPRSSPSASDPRHSKLTGAEETGLRALSLAGLVTIVWTGVLGGKLMFEHAAGIPKAAMQTEMENREAGHQHEAGEAEEHEHAAPADTEKPAGHTHPPGTAPHKR